MADKSFLLPILLAIFAGAMLPFQGAINARLGSTINNGFLAATISFGVGFLVLALLMMIFLSNNTSEISFQNTTPLMYIGGALGVVYVTTVLYVIRDVGAVNLVIYIFIGQLVLSVIIDHFSILGVPVRAFDLQRAAGLILVMVGAVIAFK